MFGKKGRTLLRRVASVLCGVVVAAECAVSAAAYSFTPVKGRNENDELVKLELYSDSALVVDMDTGQAVVDIKSDKQRVPASLTKIMTGGGLLGEFGGDKAAMEAVKYTADDRVFADLEGYSYSNADIYYGETVNCYDLFVALMLPSACDAANMIAVGMCGSINKFCERMNKKAADLGQPLLIAGRLPAVFSFPVVSRGTPRQSGSVWSPFRLPPAVPRPSASGTPRIP